jgi:hypothetical protein
MKIKLAKSRLLDDNLQVCECVSVGVWVLPIVSLPVKITIPGIKVQGLKINRILRYR